MTAIELRFLSFSEGRIIWLTQLELRIWPHTCGIPGMVNVTDRMQLEVRLL